MPEVYDPALEGFPFQVIIAADAQDNVKATVRWPHDTPSANIVKTLAAMLHHISEGHWKPPMMAAVTECGNNQSQADVAVQIIQQWNNQSASVKADELCVKPSQVFRRGMNNG